MSIQPSSLNSYILRLLRFRISEFIYEREMKKKKKKEKRKKKKEKKRKRKRRTGEKDWREATEFGPSPTFPPFRRRFSAR